jgi:hypothetical protein
MTEGDIGGPPTILDRSASDREGFVPSARRIGGRLVAVGMVALIAGLAVGALNYQPLVPGSTSGGDDPYLVSAVMSPFDDGTMYTFCRDPGKVAHTIQTLRNDGPVPITLIGPASRAEDAIQLVGLAAVRPRNPDGSIDSGSWLDASATTPLPPTVIDPGTEIELWLSFRLPTVPMSAGSTMSIRSLPIRFSVLGLERSVEVSMRDGFAFSGDPCPGH